MPNVPAVSDEPKAVQFSEISVKGYFRMQPEGFLLQKVSAIHFLPVSAKCKYRAMLLGLKQKVFPARKSLAR